MSTRTAQGAKTLARRYYTGEDVYEAETRKVFFEQWIYAGRASMLDGPGSYFLCEIESESIIVLEDGEHEIRAHHNVCRHRGTRLLTESEGRLSKSIQCRYHAWTYALDGSLIGAPFMDEVESFCQD
ncbi:MAG TPA: Rieske (2Fe-2S) protein, partial [Gemmatimonadetes bacterium]|nr:Rieske (2Fe-2S) protein [Gemmatimonadota bacterium]